MSRNVEYEEFPNGTVITWFCQNILYIKAPNPFGGFWSKSYSQLIHNRAYATDYITRRGKRWRLVDDGENGMIWTEFNHD